MAGEILMAIINFKQLEFLKKEFGNKICDGNNNRQYNNNNNNNKNDNKTNKNNQNYWWSDQHNSIGGSHIWVMRQVNK